jgi:hypothetical protein
MRIFQSKYLPILSYLIINLGDSTFYCGDYDYIKELETKLDIYKNQIGETRKDLTYGEQNQKENRKFFIDYSKSNTNEIP